MKLKLVEPLRELFKDEVRTIGIEMGLPRGMLMRHPFPGPGLGVRILGEVKKEYADTLRQADAIFMEELERSGYYDKVSQAFAVFLPVKSVGVTGDGRRYEYVVALRAVETVDFMTANWARLPTGCLKPSPTGSSMKKGASRVSFTIFRVNRLGPSVGINLESYQQSYVILRFGAALGALLRLVGLSLVVLIVSLSDPILIFVAFVEIALEVWSILADRMISISRHDACGHRMTT